MTAARRNPSTRIHNGLVQAFLPVLQRAQGGIDQPIPAQPIPIKSIRDGRLRFVPGTRMMKVRRGMATGEIQTGRQLDDVREAGWNFVQMLPRIPGLSPLPAPRRHRPRRWSSRPNVVMGFKWPTHVGTTIAIRAMGFLG